MPSGLSPEVLTWIFRYLDITSLLTVARSNKQVSGPALNIVWESLRSLGPLMNLIPPEVIDVESGMRVCTRLDILSQMGDLLISHLNDRSVASSPKRSGSDSNFIPNELRLSDSATLPLLLHSSAPWLKIWSIDGVSDYRKNWFPV
jgi:hypothetical protein